MWECNLSAEMKNNKEMNDYIKNRRKYYNKLQKVGHANIREAFFGGRTNNLQFYRETDENSEIKYLDFCSLYPYVLKYEKFPIGHPIVIREDFDYTLQNYFGFVKCSVDPPRKLYLPVLPMVIKERLVFPLCVKCHEEKNPSCECEDRSFIGTWTTAELRKAIEKGYIIKEIFEVLHYDDNNTDSNLFKQYINMWLKIKQQASGYPSWCNDEQTKLKYIENYANHEGIDLEEDKIEKNPALRFIAKIMLNSFWGKLCQRPNQSRTQIIKSYDEYFDLFTDEDKEMTSELMVTDNTLICTWQFKEDIKDNVKNYNIAVGTFVTAYARLKLYNVMEEIENIRPNSLLYFDTDSVIFYRELNDRPISIGDYLGELTDEISDKFGDRAKCINFVSLGPKNYGYVVKLENGEVHTEIKCKGICLTTKARDIITFKNMVDLAIDYSINNRNNQLKVPQRQFNLNKHCQIFTRYFDKIYKAVSEKRCISGNNTVPFGY